MDTLQWTHSRNLGILRIKYNSHRPLGLIHNNAYTKYSYKTHLQAITLSRECSPETNLSPGIVKQRGEAADLNTTR
jgi:hypothetical protein